MTSAAGLYQSGLSFVLVLLANHGKEMEPDYAALRRRLPEKGGFVHGGRKTRKNRSAGTVFCSTYSYAVLTALSAACLLPFTGAQRLRVEQYSIQLHGYRLFPETISLDAYKMLLFRKSCCGLMALRFL
ncbi:MAG: hypothetical protein ACLRZH_01970 [Ruthenibacterium lactatiformans]